MKYEIGQKVTTPLGDGEIIDVFTREDKTIKEYKVCINTYSVWVAVEDIKPYKTPHERLLEMGFEVLDITHYANKDFTHYVHSKSGLYFNFQTKNRYYYITTKNLNSPRISLELSRILTDYLEWLGEEK